MSIKHNILLSGGDAGRLGIRFVVIHRISDRWFSSLFLADIYCNGQKYIGIVKLYPLKGWLIVCIPNATERDAFEAAVFEKFDKNIYAGYIYTLKLLVLFWIKILTPIMAALLISGVLRHYAAFHNIDIVFAAKGFICVLTYFILGHIMRII